MPSKTSGVENSGLLSVAYPKGLYQATVHKIACNFSPEAVHGTVSKTKVLTDPKIIHKFWMNFSELSY